jgi:hypothetical protein
LGDDDGLGAADTDGVAGAVGVVGVGGVGDGRGVVGRWVACGVGEGRTVLGATASGRGGPERRPLATPTPYARPLVPTSSTTNIASVDHFRIVHLTSHMIAGRAPGDLPDAPTAGKVASPRVRL